MRLVSILTSALLFISLGSAAKPKALTRQDCAPFDLKDEFSPPRYQGDSNDCYAFSAADLLTSHLGLRPPASVSALNVISHYTAMNSYDISKLANHITNGPIDAPLSTVWGQEPWGYSHVNRWDERTPVAERSGGYADIVLAELSQRSAICSEAEVPSELTNAPEDAVERISFIRQRLNTLTKNFLEAESTRRGVALIKCHDKVESPFSAIEAITPQMNDLAAAKIRDELDTSCEHPIPIKPFRVRSEVFSARDRTVGDEEFRLESAKHLLKILDRKKPAEVDFDYSVLSKDGSSSHAGLIIGRRWVKDHCEVEIRNSFGTTCKNPQPKVQ